MIPDTLLGLLLAIAGFGPGYVYTLVAERRTVRPQRSSLIEAIGLLTIGALTTGVSAVIVLLVFQAVGWLQLDRWISEGAKYVGAEPTATLIAALIVLALGYLFAYALALVTHRGKEPTLLPTGTAWWQAITEAKKWGPVFATVEMKNGRLVDGYIQVYTTADVPTDEREIGLQPPIFARASARIDPADRIPMNVDSLLIPGREIRSVGLQNARASSA